MTNEMKTEFGGISSNYDENITTDASNANNVNDRDDRDDIGNNETTYEPEAFTKVFQQPSLRERIFLTLSEPSYSAFSYCLSFYFDALVALSMVLMCSETVVAWSRTPGQQTMWRVLETIITLNFMADFLVKLITARPLLRYMTTRPAFTIDLLGLLPYFLERVVEQFSEDESSSIKALRVLRLLRFFRLSRIAYENFPDVRMFIQAVRRSKLAIAFLGMYVFGAGLFFASCIYFAETSECYLNLKDGLWFRNEARSVGGEPELCSIQNMYGAWWYTLVTMTTVGYGDTVATSPWGRILTVMIMISSLVFLALPSAIFAANLTEMYLERRLTKKSHGHGHGHGHDGTSASATEKRPISPLGFLFEPSHPPRQNGEHENLVRLVEKLEMSNGQLQASLNILVTELELIRRQQQQFTVSRGNEKK